MNNDWQAALMQRHPHLFGKSGRPDVGRGWLDVLERLLTRLDVIVAFEGAGAWIRIVRIKQKFGTLRVYFEQSPVFSAAGMAVAGEMIELAEARSACTCEECGAPGRLYRWGVRVGTRCGDHAKGEPVPVRPGWEGLHVKTALKDGLLVVSCRRYDQDIDDFDDVPLPPDFKEGIDDVDPTDA